MAAGTPKPSGNTALSQRELAVVAAAWQSLQGDPKIDFEKFKHLAGYASADSARVCWRAIKKKLLANNAGDLNFSSSPSPAASGAVLKTPKSSTTTSSGVKKRTSSTTTKKKAELFSPGFKTETGSGDRDDYDELTADAEAAADAQMTPSKKTRAAGGGQKRSRSAVVYKEDSEADLDDDDDDMLRGGSVRCKKGRVTTIQGYMTTGGGGRVKIEDDGEHLCGQQLQQQHQGKEAEQKRNGNSEDTNDDHVEQFFDLEKYSGAEEA